MKLVLLSKILRFSAALLVLCSCATGGKKTETVGPVLDIPFIKNSPDECYFLDEFMPVPDRLVPGRTGMLSLRYYTYDLATYKDWERKKITLSFYSNDNLCWHLFEEYYYNPI